MTQYRLVAFDIDGTLLDSTRNLQPGTRRAFDAMHAAGTRIMLASGRPVPGLAMLARTLGLGGNLVFAGMNGSVVVDQATGQEIARHPLPQDVAVGLIQAAHAHNITVMLPHGDALIVQDDSNPRVAYEASGNDLTVQVVPDLTRIAEAPTKVLFCADRDVLELLHADLVRDFQGVIELAYSSPIYLEATARGIDKGSAITDFCQAEGIGLDQVIAFGDNGNDIGMLRTAGLGVAMGNGIPEAQEAADIVTTSNNDEGIARVLAQYFDFELPVD
ncbi:MAG: HAD family hydrolase [Kocuria sp.]|nr:HAD family hydrolase [Kocuria sp.]